MLIRMGQLEYQRKSTGNPIRKSRTTKGRTFLLNQSISQERVLPQRLTALRETGLSGFLRRYSQVFLQRAGFHEGEKGPIYRCMLTFLILTIYFFLSSHFVFFAISFKFSISQSKFPLFPPPFCSWQDPPFIVKDVYTVPKAIPVWPPVRYISDTGQYRCTISGLPLFLIFINK